jgi:hypothetical protein
MSRSPKPKGSDVASGAATFAKRKAELETPYPPYLPPKGPRVVPERTRPPRIGPACHGSVAPNAGPPRFTEELRSATKVKDSPVGHTAGGGGSGAAHRQTAGGPSGPAFPTSRGSRKG